MSVPAPPFHTYILKVASRCNLNCDYCFVYNREDQRWRDQPKLMSAETARQVAHRIGEHCQSRGKRDVSVVFHGGEPLLGGVAHLEALTDAIEHELARFDVVPRIGMQSNGILFSPAIGDFMLRRRITIGVSVDGPPTVNDRHRLDLLGQPSSPRLERALEMLLSDRYRELFSGFLMVVDVDADPVEVFEYLANWSSRGIDFILPYDNHDRFPPRKDAFESTPYGDWLIKLFDHWYTRRSGIRVREFDSIIRMLLGGSSGVESIGTGVVDLIVVETNGDLEGVDSLKASAHGAPVLGMNVGSHSFDDAAKHASVVSRHTGADSLCETCKKCELVDVCGGGYLPNRYSASRGFLNPSVYCHDLKKLIWHIHGRVRSDLEVVARASA